MTSPQEDRSDTYDVTLTASGVWDDPDEPVTIGYVVRVPVADDERHAVELAKQHVQDWHGGYDVACDRILSVAAAVPA